MEANRNSTLHNQKILIFVVFIIVFTGCLIRIYFTPPSYQVKGSILIEKRDISIERIDQFSEQSNVQINNILQKLKSSSLLSKTLQKLNFAYSITSPEFTVLQKKLNVRHMSPSNVVQITLSHPSGPEAARIVNTLVETLMEDNLLNRREKIKQALDSVQSSLSEIQIEQRQFVSLNQPSTASVNRYLPDVDAEIRKTEQQLAKLQADLPVSEKSVMEATFNSQNLIRFKPNLLLLEKKLAPNLRSGGWNNQEVKNLLRSIWIEKTKTVKSLKEELSAKLDVTKIANIDDLCAYQVKLYDLQIRQSELRSLVPGTENQPLLSEKDKQYQSLRELEARLIKKQVELENVDEFSFTEISWIDKAIPSSEQSFPPKNIYLVFGLSFCIALVISLVAGLFYAEYKNYSRDYKYSDSLPLKGVINRQDSQQ